MDSPRKTTSFYPLAHFAEVRICWKNIPRTTAGYLRRLQAKQLNRVSGTKTFFSSGLAFGQIDELDPNSNCI